jgi:hypothetical protein
MAEGQAWVIRNRPAETGGMPAASAAGDGGRPSAHRGNDA